MPKRQKKSQKSQTKSRDFVVAIFAENLEEARDYEALLKANKIPTMLKDQSDSSTDRKEIAVMVPEEFIDEAYVIIESQDAYDDFYDFGAEDEDDDDDGFGTGFFDDKF